MQWEYRQVMETAENFEAVLNELGSDGWELVFMTVLAGTSPVEMVGVLKRQRTGRSTIQTPPQIAPSPTVEVSIASPCGPRPNTLSAKPGNSSIKPRVPIVVTVNNSIIGAMPS